jgi:hypothetical protein
MVLKIAKYRWRGVVVLAILLAGIAFIMLVGGTDVNDSRACQFTGAVEVGGVKVPDGTVITAIIDGDEYYTVTPSIYGSSRYCLVVEPPEGREYPYGEEVTFKIDGHDTEQSGIYKAGSNMGLDLTAYTSVPQSSANFGMIIGASAGLIMCVGLICFLLHLDRILKRLAVQVPASNEPFETSTVVIELYLD